MKTRIAIFIFALCLTTIIKAQEPQWYEQQNIETSFPKHKYYTGRDAVYAKKNDHQGQEAAKEEALQSARVYLTASISTTIESTIQTKVEDLASTSLNSFYSRFRSQSSQIANATLEGMEQFGPEYDPKTRKAYALVYVNKEKLLLKKTGELDMLIRTMESKYRMAKSFNEQSDEVEALELLTECEELYNKFEITQGLAFSLSDDKKYFDQYLKIREEINSLNADISKSKSIDITEGASLLFEQLKNMTGRGRDFKHIIAPGDITFEESIYPSRFSNLLAKELKNLMVTERYSMASDANNDYAEITLSGDYYVLENSVKVFVKMIGKATDREFAAATTIISRKLLDDEGIPYIPEEIERVQRLREGIVAPSEERMDSVLYVDFEPRVENNVFGTGDSIRLFVRVNKPAYIRILYLEADGDVIRLVPDLRISENGDVFRLDNNKMIAQDGLGKILYLRKLGCGKISFAGPNYGDETIYFAASSLPFINLSTKIVEYDCEDGKCPMEQILDKDFMAISKTKSVIVNHDNPGSSDAERPFYEEAQIPVRVVP